MDGLKRGADSSTTISVQTLFTRTLRSLMFDNVPWFPCGVVCLTPFSRWVENLGGLGGSVCRSFTVDIPEIKSFIMWKDREGATGFASVTQ